LNVSQTTLETDETRGDLPLKPIYLFADSQLLFWKNGEAQPPFLASLRAFVPAERPKAAYLGASNGDNPDYYAIFEAAMAGIGIEECRMIRSEAAPEDRAFLEQADIILLAGGDVEKGWVVFKETGLKETIVKRYYDGAVLIGISAGAVQLGLFGWPETFTSATDLFETFKLLPFMISAHGEKQEWTQLKDAVRLMQGTIRGLGIPSGGGLIYYGDHTLEPIRHPLYEITWDKETLRQSLLFFDPTSE
jgi:cyanophycinase